MLVWVSVSNLNWSERTSVEEELEVMLFWRTFSKTSSLSENEKKIGISRIFSSLPLVGEAFFLRSHMSSYLGKTSIEAMFYSTDYLNPMSKRHLRMDCSLFSQIPWYISLNFFTFLDFWVYFPQSLRHWDSIQKHHKVFDVEKLFAKDSESPV